MRSVIILGATGSIGTTALTYLRMHRDQFAVKGVVAYSSKSKLIAIAEEFRCPFLLMENHKDEDLFSFLSQIDADIILNGIAGARGLYATIAGLRTGKDIALANKETIVMGGPYVLNLAKQVGHRIIPVDSEHSAINHLLVHKNISRLIITASGGPFIDRANTDHVTLEEALKHPTWKMGKKISIDSATLANKGLEVIEASYLFGFPADKIDVVIHRQSIVHSMVYTADGAIYAAMSPPDMTHPIITALSDEKLNLCDIVKPLDFTNLTLTFEKPDLNRFPLLSLAYDALRNGGSYPIAFNAADEVAVNEFINGGISYNSISKIVDKVFQSDFSLCVNAYEDIVEMDQRARKLASEAID